MKQKIISLLLCASLVFTAAPLTASAATGGETVADGEVATVSGNDVPDTHSHYNCGVSECSDTLHAGNAEHAAVETWTAYDGTTTLDGGSYYLTEDVTPASIIDIRGTVNICLNGHTLSRTGGVFIVREGAVLNLCDCAGEGIVTGGAGNDVAVSVNNGTFNMFGGSISETTGTSYSGGVWLYGGSFNLYDGVIANNSGTFYGGGVAVSGTGAFTMYGGSITGNTAGTFGGGVCVYEGGFTMYGGSITDNTAGTSGGGVYIYAYSDNYANLSGTPAIYSNRGENNATENLVQEVNTSETSSIYITGELKEGASVGVLRKWSPYGDQCSLTGAFVTAGSGYTITESDLGKFCYEDTTYSIVLRDNTLVVGTDIGDATVTLSSDSCVYTGEACEVGVDSVILGDTTLTEGTDYTVSYSNNISVGAASVLITGIGDYVGSCTASFEITKSTIVNATVELSTDQCLYTGEAQVPGVTVKVDGRTLTERIDYTVSGTDNIDVGCATLTITGIGNYEGSYTCPFWIIKSSVDDAKVTLSSSSYSFTNTAKKPTVTVKVGSRTLTQGTDYTVSYKNNINVGTATVTVTGMGNYEGTYSTTFKINAASISSAKVTLSSSSYSFTNTAKKPTVTVKVGSQTLTAGTDYTVSYSNNTKIGTAKVTVTGKGNYKGSISKSFTITAPAVGSTFTVGNIKYKVTNASSRTLTVVGGTSKTLTSVSIPDTVDIGKTYKVTAIENNAFKGYNKLKTVTIGAKVKTIGDKAFYNCTALKTLKINTKVSATIGEKAFYNCKALTTLKTGDYVTAIGDYAFQKCTGLKTVTIGTKVKTIGAGAFKGCTAMTKFTCNSTVLKTIGKQAFNGDKKLKTIVFKSSKITGVGDKAFTGVPKTATVKVPSAKVSAYTKQFQKAGLNKSVKIKKISN